MNAVLDQIRQVFAGVQRPAHFTDYQHCEECAEHDQTLASNTPDTITLNELGNPGWDPICFATPQAFLYYMPALARLALDTGEDGYLDQLLFRINSERRMSLFDKDHLAAVIALLEHIRDREHDMSWFLKDDLLGCIELLRKTAEVRNRIGSEL
jgi:hypothetical protein